MASKDDYKISKRKRKRTGDVKGPKTQLFLTGVTVHMGKTTVTILTRIRHVTLQVRKLLDNTVSLCCCRESFL